MVTVLTWTAEMDAEILRCLPLRAAIPPGYGLGDLGDPAIANRLNVSPSAVQRRRVFLAGKEVRAEPERRMTVERQEAGLAPLPVGHPIAMAALRAALEMRV